MHFKTKNMQGWKGNLLPSLFMGLSFKPLTGQTEGPRQNNQSKFSFKTRMRMKRKRAQDVIETQRGLTLSVTYGRVDEA